MPRPPRTKTNDPADDTGTPGLMSIGALSRASGIPIQTIRTWERRYASPASVRKPSGHRLYPAAAVSHLRKVSELLRRGHRPGEVLTLPGAKLDALLALPTAVPPAPEVPRRAVLVTPGPGQKASVAALLDAVLALDRDALLAMLRANWSRMGPLGFLEDCAGPLMVAVGQAWCEGRAEVRHEHFATACLGGLLREVREPFDERARGPRVVAGTLPGDLHEGGLLMASVVLAMEDRRVLYLGSNVPVSEIASTAREQDAEAVAISVSQAMRGTRASKLVTELRRALPKRVQLWVGGAGAPATQDGFERFSDLASFDARIRGGR